MKRESITERLREIRSRFGLSQPEIADKIGVTERMYASAEEGTTPPNFKLLTGLYSALGVSADYILYGKGAPFLEEDTSSTEVQRLQDVHARYKAIVEYLMDNMNYNYGDLAKELNVTQNRIRRMLKGGMPNNGGAYYELIKLERTYAYRIAYAREAKRVYGLQDSDDLSTLYRVVIDRIRAAGDYTSFKEMSEHMKLDHNQMYPRYKRVVKARIDEVEYICDFAANKLELPRVAPIVYARPEHYNEDPQSLLPIDDSPILFSTKQNEPSVSDILPEVKAMIREEMAKIAAKAAESKPPIPPVSQSEEEYRRSLRETQDLALRFIERRAEEEARILREKFGYKKDDK